MCGRFTQHATWAQVAAFSQPLVIPEPDFAIAANWNITPSSQCWVIAQQARALVSLSMRWGLHGPTSLRPINARSETVASNGLFRQSFAQRRCVVPATGWYEWNTADPRLRGVKQPYWFHPSAQPMLWFAGIFSQSSFAILTRDALDISVPIHDRSPILLDTSQLLAWLAPDAHEAALYELMDNRLAPELAVHPVSRAVSSNKASGPQLIEPSSPEFQPVTGQLF
jgi:putative SOS response-associated peptidase YedK